jgi:AraC-like DNA-binding protein
MSKLVFSSDELPRELDDHARFAAWCDIYLGTICHFDVERLTDLPFSMRYEYLKIGDVALAGCEGTIHRIRRTAQQAAADACDNFYVSINGTRPWALQIRGRSQVYAPGSLAFLCSDGPTQGEHAGGAAWQGLVLSRSRVNELVRDPDDLVGRTFDPDSEASRYLKRYVEMLLASGTLGPELSAHVETTLLDLVAILLNGRRDTVDLTHFRGLKAARLQAILTEIKQGFARPDFSPRLVAAKLGLSVNYIQKVLRETGMTFTDRVLELRLQKGRVMLAEPGNDRLKVSDIALACGFNEVSYFNRCFRRRFGAAPTELRGRS